MGLGCCNVNNRKIKTIILSDHPINTSSTLSTLINKSFYMEEPMTDMEYNYKSKEILN